MGGSERKLDSVVSLNIRREPILYLDLLPSYRISHIEDLDDDGIVEIIVTTKYSVKTYKLSDGSLMWQFELMEGELLSTSLRDINLDGENEILMLVSDNGSRWIYILDKDGSLLSTIEVGDKDFSLGNLKPIKLNNQQVILLLHKIDGLSFFTLEGMLIWRLSARLLYHTLGDFNRDGKDELFVVYRRDDVVYIALIDLQKFEPIWVKDIGIVFERDPFVEEKKVGKDSVILVFFGEKLKIFSVSKGEKVAELETDVLEIFSGVGDIDGDKERELILVGVNEYDLSTNVNIIWPQEKRKTTFMVPIMVNDVRTGDYDGDGRDEIALVGFNEVIFIGIEGEKWQIRDIFDSEIYASHGEDFDRDGNPEILVIGEKGAAIVDLADKSILWMDNDIVLHEIDYLLGIGDILPVDIDGDGDDEWLLIDDSSGEKTKILVLKGSYGSIKELWSRELRIDYIKDVEILYPNGLIILVAKDELIALDNEGNIVWRCKNCPSDYLLFADTTGDGSIEIIVFQRRHGIKVLDSRDGRIIWTYKGEITGTYLGDVNGDGKYEIIVNRSDAIQILDGSTGMPIYTLLIESKFKRVDVFDVDMDDFDEIVIYRKTGLFLVKDFSVKWELNFLDPTKIRKIEAVRLDLKDNIKLLITSGKTLYILDPFKGPIVDKIEIEKYVQNYILVDIKGSGKKHIALLTKDKRELVVIGEEGYRYVKIPIRRKFKLKVIPTKKMDLVILVSNNALWVLNPYTYTFERILSLREKIIDVSRTAKSLILLSSSNDKTNKYYKVYRFHISMDIKPRLLQLENIVKLESSSLHNIDKVNINNIELLYMSSSRIIIVDWRNKRLLNINPVNGFASIMNVDNLMLSPNYYLGKGIIVAWRDNILYILDPYHQEILSIKVPSIIRHLAVGDIDGDSRSEIILVNEKHELCLIDPFLYKLGCKKIYNLGFTEPINLLNLADVDNDSVDELLVLKSRGIEAIKLHIFDRELLSYNHRKDVSELTIDEITMVKIRTLCDKETKKLQAKINMLKAKSRLKPWKKLSEKKDTNSEEN